MIDTRRLIECCDWIVNRRAVSPEGEQDLQFIELIRSIREGVYLASVISDSSLKELWVNLEKYNEDGQVIILECIAELKVLSGLSESDWTEVCHLVGRSCSYNTTVKSAYNDAVAVSDEMASIPRDTRTQVFPSSQAEHLIEANHWFVFIVLMSYGSSRLGVNVNGRVKSPRK